MRKGIGIAVVVAMGLIWSVAVMSQLGPRGQRGNEVGSGYPDPLIQTAAASAFPEYFLAPAAYYKIQRAERPIPEEKQCSRRAGGRVPRPLA